MMKVWCVFFIYESESELYNIFDSEDKAKTAVQSYSKVYSSIPEYAIKEWEIE